MTRSIPYTRSLSSLTIVRRVFVAPSPNLTPAPPFSDEGWQPIRRCSNALLETLLNKGNPITYLNLLQ
jgi:hypothetical protein